MTKASYLGKKKKKTSLKSIVDITLFKPDQKHAKESDSSK